MNTIRQDFAFAIRLLVRRPGFTIVAALTLAVGIAANTVIFTLVNGVALRPLPFPHPERLVSLWSIYASSNGQPDIFSPPNYLDVAARAKTLDAAGGYDEINFALAGAGEPESVAGVRMTASMTRVLGVPPQLGRWFTEAEDRGGERVALLSDSIWRERFGGDRGVLGRTLALNGRAYTVIGVLPPGIGFPSVLTRLYTPMSFSPDELAGRGSIFLNVVARVRSGVERPKVEAELSAIASSLAHDYPAADEGLRMGTVPLARDLMGDARTIVLVLWAAVAFLLAVGCANVANLLLTHAVARRREFALRLSLGAGGSRLIRQLLTESLALAAVGGILGLALAYWALPQTLALLPRNFPRVRELRLDSTVLWFTFGVSIVTGLLFGLAPALGLVRRDLAQSLREGGAGAGRGVSHRRLGRVLAAGEVALVLVLTIGAGLVLRSLWRLSAVDPGFPARGVAAWQLFLPSARYPDGASQRAFYRNVLEQVRALPGVESAGLGGPLPFGPVNLIEDGGFRIEGRTEPSADRMPQALFTRASAGYFAALGIPVKRGRVFDTRDHESAAPAAVISETLARRYFAGQDPVGRRLLLGRGRLPAEIVGVVGDVKHNSLRSVTRPELYLPLPRFPQASAGLV
ncbi:MAG TPA: ABC transporter permease, partial [Bryobacteraceae bacterium]